MKKKLTNNLLLKILSAVAAVIVWIVVINIDNPTETFTISGIPIEVLNEQSITENDLTYEFPEDKTVSVQVTARRTDRRKISADDFKATVDLSQIYGATGSVAVNITIVDNKALIRSWTQITRSVKVDVEEMQTREFEIQIEHSGEPADSYAFSDEVVTPAIVRVTAPESIMDIIDHAAVTVDVGGISDDVETTAAVKLYTRTGREVEADSKLTMNITEAKVSMSAVKTNQISVDIKVTGQDQVADGYKYITYECEPQTIYVTGAKALIATLDKLTIEEDLTGASGNVTKTYQVSDLLPEGLEVADKQPETIEVTYQIEKLAQKSFLIMGDQVELTGADPDLEYRMGDDNAITVMLEGLSEDLDSVTASDIRVTLDVSDISRAGTYERLPSAALPEEYSDYYEVLVSKVRVIVTSTVPPSESASEESSTEPPASESSGESGTE